MESLTFDQLIAILENDTRRRILQKLAQEVHYPLQLARELRISQQAVTKHLKVLEDNKLVECVEEQSSLGPPRKCYRPTRSFSLSIDFGTGTFDTRMTPLDGVDVKGREYPELSKRLKKLETAKDKEEFLKSVAKLMADVNDEIDALDSKRAELVSMKDRALNSAYARIRNLVSDYEMRKVLYYIVENNDWALESIAEELEMRDKNVKDLMDRLLEQGLWV